MAISSSAPARWRSIRPRTSSSGGDVEAQARLALQNLAGVLEEAGSSLGRALRLTVYLRDMGDFARVNAVYATFFSAEAPPARAAVEVAGLPKGALVEIDCIAVRG